MSDSNIALTPSDLAGSIQRAADELSAYIRGNAVLAIDIEQCKAHVSRIFELCTVLGKMQEQMRPPQAPANGNGAEARAN